MRISSSTLRSGWFRTLMFGGTILCLAWMLQGADSTRNAGDPSGSEAAASSPVEGGGNVADNEIAKAESLSRMFRQAANKVLPAVVVIKAGSSPVCAAWIKGPVPAGPPPTMTV